MSHIQQLHRLQQIDSKLDAHRERYREVNAALKDDRTLRDARETSQSLQDRLRPQKAHSNDLSLKIKATVTQSEQLSQRLYSGKVQNPKELTDIQDKIAALKRQRSKLEDELLESMITVEELQAAFDTAQERLAVVEQSWEQEQSALADERQQIKQEARQLRADREASVAALPADTLALYEELRQAKGGQAVARLEGESCAACAVAQTSNIIQKVRQRQEITFCVSCGRILVDL